MRQSGDEIRDIRAKGTINEVLSHGKWTKCQGVIRWRPNNGVMGSLGQCDSVPGSHESTFTSGGNGLAEIMAAIAVTGTTRAEQKIVVGFVLPLANESVRGRPRDAVACLDRTVISLNP